MSFQDSPRPGIAFKPDTISTEEITKEISVPGLYEVVSDAVRGGMGYA